MITIQFSRDAKFCKAKVSKFPNFNFSSFDQRLVMNLFSQLCQVEHCLFESKLINSKWRNFDYLERKLTELKVSITEKKLTRNQGIIFKRIWLKAYSFHGRKWVFLSSNILFCEQFNTFKILFHFDRQSLKTVAVFLNSPKLKYDDLYSNPFIILKSDDLDIYK